MVITDKLRNQIIWMCGQVSKFEWSGVLFYSTTGEKIEDPDFSIVAEELYLLDIGLSTYTEYEYEGDIVAHMMNNPRLMEMSRGHIHSHAGMRVFFSPIDTDEIKGNSEYFNYYLSLIVNNRNEMVAKVAFRCNTKSCTTREVFYKGLNGEELTNEETYYKEESSVGIYDCKIVPSYIPDAYLVEKKQKLERKKEEKEEEKKSKHNSDTTEISYGKRVTDVFDYSDHKSPDLFNYNKRDQDLMDCEEFMMSLLGLESTEDLGTSFFLLNRRVDLVDYIQKRFSLFTDEYYMHYGSPLTRDIVGYFVDAFDEILTPLQKEYPYIVKLLMKEINKI